MLHEVTLIFCAQWHIFKAFNIFPLSQMNSMKNLNLINILNITVSNFSHMHPYQASRCPVFIHNWMLNFTQSQILKCIIF